MANVTLIGGSGLIGTALSESLLANGQRVRVLDLVPPQPHIAAAVDWIRCDIREQKQMSAIESCDTVYLLAALLGKRCSEDPENGWRTNIVGQANVIEAICRLPVLPKVCFLSSASVYQALETNGPIVESSPIFGNSLYATSKIIGENLLRAAGCAFGLRSYILRPFTVYGPGPGSAYKGHFVSTWIERALAGEPLIVHGNGRQTVDLVHVADLAALCHLANRADFASTDAPALNVGCGTETSLIDFLGWIREFIPQVQHYFETSIKPQRYRSWVDISAARNLVGYEPKVVPKDGITELLRNQLGKMA